MEKTLYTLLTRLPKDAIKELVSIAALDGKVYSKDVTADSFQKIKIKKLVFDSREVEEDSLYFALPGTHTSGNRYINEAIKRGASVIVYEGKLGGEEGKEEEEESFIRPVIFIKVLRARHIMAAISATFYDEPSKSLIVIGVTGTEGKSSTVSFIWQLLRLLGKKAGFISTVERSYGEEAVSNIVHQTTPEAPIIQEALHKMLKAGCEYAVLECSSHGLSEELNRTGSIEFDVACFMNVTLEHLEFHKTFSKYRADKDRLFLALNCSNHIKSIGGVTKRIMPFGVVNLDDKSALYFIASTNYKVYGVSMEGELQKVKYDKDDIKIKNIEIPCYYAKEIEDKEDALNFKECKSIVSIKETGKEGEGEKERVEVNLLSAEEGCKVESALPGKFNIYNILTALIVASKLTGKKISAIAPYAKKITAIKGRWQKIETGEPYEVIVDYAHTPSSFKMIFPPIKERCKGRLVAVFGSAGERDTAKRSLQGSIAACYANKIILTNEDPRGEEALDIIKEIGRGAIKEGFTLGKNLFYIVDRREAIRAAVKEAKENDIILLLGKSHENSIICKDRALPYDEIQEAKDAIRERLSGKL